MRLLFTLLTVFAITSTISSSSPAIDMAIESPTRFHVITQAEAIQIAAQFVKEKDPHLDISVRPPVAKFFPRGFSTDGKEVEVWAVNFGIPAPPGYTRSIISHHVWIDRYGRIVAGPSTTSP